jgi:lysyl-tRNA synthetase class 2
MDLFQFVPGYETHIYNHGREPALVMLLAFIITFILTRAYTRIARVRGWGSAHFGNVHTHHMVFGMVLAFAAGGALIAFLPDPGLFLLVLAAAFGTGVALVLDEFALFFHLQDVYWEREGRKSVDAVVLGLAFGLLFLMQVTPFETSGDDPAWLLTGAILIDLPIVLIAALKGKIYLAIFGVFIPFLALIAAIRLAEPGSMWARRFYNNRGKKWQRTVKRYEQYEKKWRPRKERLWDIIGGKTGRPLLKD